MSHNSPRQHAGIVTRVPSAEAALELARQWRAQGRADWFRGQVCTWPPQSSLARWRQELFLGTTWSSSPALNRFSAWARNLPEMSLIADDDFKLAAVAQHFGIPTDLIDFSVSPDVAALFSRDRPGDATYASDEACIYCLNMDAMYDWFKSIPREEAEKLQLYPVTVDLPELHRLSAQEGLFMHASTNWYELFEPDCIIFPRGPVLTPLERLSIYPPTSKLEEDLQAFAHANGAYEVAEFSERLRKGSVIHLKPSQGLRDSCFAVVPSPRADWPSKQNLWASGTYAPRAAPVVIKWPSQKTKMGNAMLAMGLRHQLEETLKRNTKMWRDPIRFEISGTPGLLEISEAAGVSDAATRAWNGMAGFPYSDDQRLACFERIVLLGSASVGSWNSEINDKLVRMLSESPDDLDRWVLIHLAAHNGASSKALVCFSDLVGSLRKDMDGFLSQEGRALVERDPVEFIRRVREPALIMDFRRLVDCFVQDVVPTQALLQRTDLPVMFSPAQVVDLWPARGADLFGDH